MADAGTGLQDAVLLHAFDIAIDVIGRVTVDAITHLDRKIHPCRFVPDTGKLVKIRKQQPAGAVIAKSKSPLLPVPFAAPFVAGDIAVELVESKSPVVT